MEKSTKIYYSDGCGDAKNCYYPHVADMMNETELKTALAHDHVLAEYRHGRRSIENFISSNAVGLDVDNEHTDEAKNWITAADIEDMFYNVDYVLVYSRHHMKEKGSGEKRKSARPRFHIYFPVP